MQVELTEEQQAAVDTLAVFPYDVQTLGGYAGTGKTTVIRSLVERLNNPAVCAFTGKAAQVLRKKGVPATTIHSLIYKVVGGEDGEPVEFMLKEPSELMKDEIVIDEGSMVPEQIYNDLRTFGVPLIFVGDHGQLEPVGASSFNLMESSQVTLTKIHRNAGEIALFAQHLRNGHGARDWHETQEWRDTNPDDVKVQIVETLDDVEGITEDCQLICAYNRTRTDLNKVVRQCLGRPEGPCPDDRIICLQNDRRLRIFNGMQGKIEWINGRMLDFRTDDFKVKVAYHPDSFGKQKPTYQRGVIPFDWAYCVTCHKAQGDEWDHVIVVEQRCSKWSHQRWAYTAASRAKNKLTWVLE